MYPERELNRLATHKACLRRNLARHRAECAQAARRVAQPIQWLDRALDFWRRLSPFTRLAVLPLGLMGARQVMPRLKWLGRLLRWGPPLFGVLRSLSATRGRAARG